MKIIHIVNGNDTGGAMTQILSLITSQRERHKVELLFVGDGLLCEKCDEIGINYKIFTPNISGIYKLSKYIKKINSHSKIFHFHGLKPMMSATITKYLCEYNNICTIHSDFYEEYVKKTFKNSLAIHIMRFAIKRIDHFITVSSKFSKLLYDLGVPEENVNFIPNGIDVNNIKIDKTREEFLQEKDIKYQDKIICGIAARLHPVKGIDFLIEVARYLKDTNVILLVAGIGEINYVNNLKEKAKEYKLDDTLYFIGYVNDIYNFYNAIDINLLTSVEEGVSYSVMEGGSLAKPIISTDVSGMKSLIDDKINGLVVKDRDPQKFAGVIRDLANNKRLRNEYGQSLRNKVINNFTNEKMAMKYEAIYTKIIEERNDGKKEKI